jgi:hypothetical protein
MLLDQEIIDNGGEPKKSIFSPDKPIELTNPNKHEESKGMLSNFPSS